MNHLVSFTITYCEIGHGETAEIYDIADNVDELDMQFRQSKLPILFTLSLLSMHHQILIPNIFPLHMMGTSHIVWMLRVLMVLKPMMYTTVYTINCPRHTTF